MNKFTKAIVAGVGFAVVIAREFFQVDLGLNPDMINTVAGVIGTWAVYWFANK